jgi:glycerol-3-phosphate dehydrogenase (NAD(P)+)
MLSAGVMDGTTRVAFEQVSIFGGGAWGTALAHTLAQGGHRVTLWARETEVVADINERHVNRMFLSGVALDPSIKATSETAIAASADVCLMVAPAQYTRGVLSSLQKYLKPNTPIVLCSKGIEQFSRKMLTDVTAEVAPNAPLAVLSGPSFAADVARGLPAALTLACKNETLGRALVSALSSKQMRLYWSSDVTGAELGGALKNVLAIAAGIVEGRGLGASAHAAIVARGFAEMRRLGEALGARPETLLGLSGLGDLILTCGSAQSRNMSLGRALGEGRSLEDILGSRTAVTEGVTTAKVVVELARAHNLDMPIAESVNAIIDGRLSVDAAITALMQRPLKAED